MQVALEASIVPPEGAPESELEQHRLAKIVDGLIDRKVQDAINGRLCAACACACASACAAISILRESGVVFFFL